MHIEDKLTILADAAKYDVSCASSGSRRKNVRGFLGNAAPAGEAKLMIPSFHSMIYLKEIVSNTQFSK
jgi:predicted DNA-binding helix-hairpin-helix protein